MIRGVKSEVAPASLASKKHYNGEDVQQQLLEDHKGKCYICERNMGTDFEIEHLVSQSGNDNLRYEWGNLLVACGYCNKRKSNGYDKMVNPLQANVEDEIKQELDWGENKAVFTALVDDEAHRNTVMLLMRLHNGKMKMRSTMEGEFWREIKSKMNDFRRKVDVYLEHPTEENRALVSGELRIEKELLGFKYWIIRDNEQLNREFGGEMVWNKK